VILGDLNPCLFSCLRKSRITYIVMEVRVFCSSFVAGICVGKVSDDVCFT
jgi:hypothetical protein